MKILVTGGAGYIGSHAILQLAEMGHETVVFDNLSTGYRDLVLAGDIVTGDLSDTNKLAQVFGSYNFDAVLHFAAHSQVSESMKVPLKYYNNIANTVRLLEAMKTAKVKKLIFSSTAAVYGNPKEIPIIEDAPKTPVNPYGMSKKLIEYMLGDCCRAWDLKYVALRYFNACGAEKQARIGEKHNPETHLIPLILRAAAGKIPYIEIFGTDYETPDGTCIRDYIHVTDLVHAHIIALDYLSNNGDSQALNLGIGRGFSVTEVLAAAKKVTGCTIPAKDSARRPGDPPVLVADAKKAKHILGWKPQILNLEDMIFSAWKWHQK